MSQKQGYLDFDEYIRQGEPSQREAALLGARLLAYRLLTVSRLRNI